MKLTVKLIVSFSCLLVLLIGIGVFSLTRMAVLYEDVHEISTNWLPSIKAIGELNDLLSQYRRAGLVHILYTDPTEIHRQEQEMAAVQKKLDQAMQRYESLISEPAEKENYPKMMQAWKKYVELQNEIFVLSRKNENEAATKIATGQQRQSFREVVRYAELLVDINAQGAQKLADGSVGAYFSGKMWIWGAILVSVAFGIGLTILISRNVFGQLGEDPGYLEHIAREIAGGNLDLQFKPVIGQGGVYGVLVKMVDTLKAKILEADQKTGEAAREAQVAREATQQAEEATRQAERAKAEGMLQAAGELESVVEVVTSASEELSSQVEQSSRGAEQQSQRVGETATAMEEMNATVLEVAKNAAMASESSDNARQKAVDGAGIVGQVVQGIAEVRKQAQALKQDMSALGKQAEGIGQVMNVISDIADQTNLLALNAAIEAARAGEAGRGFAVVADEVRKLAEKTMTATKEVGDSIRGIQEGTRKNMDNVDRTAKTIEEATLLATQSGEALTEIVNLVDHTSDQVRSIATASEEQSAASEEINRSIEHVATISSETAQAMSQASQAVTDLARQSQVLQNLLAGMKSDGGGATTPRPLALGRA
ncbi:methyl-accepting chemotaxis protein [Fundidesulfovibrio butyratiphilus]